MAEKRKHLSYERYDSIVREMTDREICATMTAYIKSLSIGARQKLVSEGRARAMGLIFQMKFFATAAEYRGWLKAQPVEDVSAYCFWVLYAAETRERDGNTPLWKAWNHFVVNLKEIEPYPADILREALYHAVFVFKGGADDPLNKIG